MAAETQGRLALRANLYFVDYVILGLAFVSLLLFLLDHSALPERERQVLLLADLALVGLYGTAFALKWAVAEEPLRWLRRNALHALGAFPLTVNLFEPVVAERYFVIVQVLIVVLRFGEALDRAFGARVLSGLFERYRSMVVEELTDPLLMRLAIVLEDAVVNRDYAAAIGRRLDERRDLVEAAVSRAIAASPKLSRLSRFGPVEKWIDETTQEIVDAAHAALTGPEVNTLIREGLQDVFAELRAGISQRNWQGKGVGVTDVARGVVTVSDGPAP